MEPGGKGTEPQEQFDDRSVGASTGFETTRQAEGVGAAAERAREAAGDAVRDAKERLNRVYERSRETVSDAYNRAMDYSRENPRNATLVALGAGFGMGLLVAFAMPGGSRRGGNRRFLPTAVNLAETIVDVFGRR